MLLTRVIPCLLLRRAALVKTVRFKNPTYVGDPINTVRIFNEAEVDELVFLDITATPEDREPQFDLVEEISQECFMPFAYGGGLRRIGDIQRILGNGAEKVVLNTCVWRTPQLVTEAANRFGSQSVVVSIDVRKNFWGNYSVMVCGGRENTKMNPVELARRAVDLGAGELFVTSIDQEGGFKGYDLDLIGQISEAVEVPVVGHGGAGDLDDVRRVVTEAGASAAAAGSLFVYQGPQRAVLINYPKRGELDRLFET